MPMDDEKRLAPGAIVTSHLHDGCALLQMILEGRAEAAPLTNSQKQAVLPGADKTGCQRPEDLTWRPSSSGSRLQSPRIPVTASHQWGEGSGKEDPANP